MRSVTSLMLTTPFPSTSQADFTFSTTLAPVRNWSSGLTSANVKIANESKQKKQNTSFTHFNTQLIAKHNHANIITVNE